MYNDHPHILIVVSDSRKVRNSSYQVKGKVIDRHCIKHRTVSPILYKTYNKKNHTVTKRRYGS